MKQPKSIRRTTAGAVALTCFAMALPLPAAITNPVMYVTQVPPSRPHRTVTSIGGSHLASADAAPRGGDLMIIYPNGTQRNLTRLGGFGSTEEAQTSDAIAVRDPHIHWSGTRAIFSMVNGAAVNPAPDAFYWQLYEITGFGLNENPVITKVPGQPAGFNNIQPAYLPDGGIVFVSDRTRDGTKHLYPAIDEQGSAPANTGLWKLRGSTLTLLEHSPSGSFEPMVDSYGRVLFSRWDHLQRDAATATGGGTAGAFDYASEYQGASWKAGQYADVFPDPFKTAANPLGLEFDLFMPWTVRQDGSDLVTLNHVGRHEFGVGFNRSRDDANLVDFVTPLPQSVPLGSTRAASFLQMSEHPSTAGRFIATDAVLTSVSAGRLLTISGAPSEAPQSMVPMINTNNGFSRDASWLADGRLIGSFVPGSFLGSTYGSAGGGPVIPPDSMPPGPFRIRTGVTFDGLNFGTTLTTGIQVTRTNYAPGNVTTTYSGLLWELQPVEVRSRPQPPVVYEADIPAPEASMFIEARVAPSKLKSWMSERSLALLTCRDVTSRDSADLQQPVNLKVPGGTRTSTGSGPVYDVTRVKFFQADYVRGYGLSAAPGDTPDSGRRALAVPMHEGYNENPPVPLPPDTVQVSPDGSMASFVPAHRGVSWQLAGNDGEAVVRERYWLSFKAGEVRTCTSCHGVNSVDQAGRTVSTNAPQALRSLLASWKVENPDAGAATHYQVWSETTAPAATAAGEDTDGDGISNLLEYAYGSNPLVARTAADAAVPVSAAVTGALANSYPAIRFTASTAADSVMVLETSSDLTNWTAAATADNRGQCVPEAGFTRTVVTTAEQSVQNLVEYEVRGTAMLTEGVPRYFRMKVVAR